MLQIYTHNIHTVKDLIQKKEEAISRIVASSAQASNILVKESYVDYVNDGSAILCIRASEPDQCPDNLVQILKIPHGISWDEEYVVYIVICLILTSESSKTLSGLKHILSDNSMAEKLKKAKDVREINELLDIDSIVSAEFTIHNEHGIHTRPGSILVNTIKKFSSRVTATNLSSARKPVNARSLMKLVSLGIKRGHRLQFTAQGADNEQVLKAISHAISDGLGEGSEKNRF